MNLREIVKAALAEDIGTGDITSKLILNSSQRGVAQVIAKSDGVLSGLTPFREVFHQLDAMLEVHSRFEEGAAVHAGEEVAKLEGTIVSILMGERTALNFLQRLSGIATLTRRYVEEIKGTKAVILDTRKTTPLMRSLEKDAVKHGGGNNHRRGLFDMILIKENHEIAAGGIAAALTRLENNLRKANKPLTVDAEIEIQNLDQLAEVLSVSSKLQALNIKRILLDNFDLGMIKRAVQRISGHFLVEVSGGVSLQNVREIARCGVDYISVGALTHSAPSMDFSLTLKK